MNMELLAVVLEFELLKIQYQMTVLFIQDYLSCLMAQSPFLAKIQKQLQ